MSTLRDILFLTKHIRCGQSSQFGALDNLPVSCKSIIFRLKYIRNLFTSIHKVTKDVEMNKEVESLSQAVANPGCLSVGDVRHKSPDLAGAI